MYAEMWANLFVASHSSEELLLRAYTEKSAKAEFFLPGFRLPFPLLPSWSSVRYLLPVVSLLACLHPVLVPLAADRGDVGAHSLHLVSRKEASYHEIAVLVE